MSDIQEEQKRLYKRAEENDKEQEINNKFSRIVREKMKDKSAVEMIVLQDEEINKLTAESTEWEERTYCWQDRAENLQIVLDKIKEYIKNTEELYIVENNEEEGLMTPIKNIKELLEEIE
jgi:hypothetical protein